VLEALVPALVLGSAQPGSDADPAAIALAGVDLARRRSGGGAVLVGPREVLWVDALIPPADRLWQADVGRAAWWIGEAWAVALREIGFATARVWQGPLRRSRWSSKICFAGVGSGEVCTEDGKVVGISQRRTRFGTLLQSAALLTWDPERTVGLMSIRPDERSGAVEELRGCATAVGADRGPELLEALLNALPI
jgi:lipoate-protein ligase A